MPVDDALNAAAENGLLLLYRPEHAVVHAILTLAHRVLPLTGEAGLSGGW